MENELIETASEIITSLSGQDAAEGTEAYCALALIDEGGYPTVSTITPSRSEGIEWLTFCTGLSSNKAKRIEKNSRASVCFSNLHYNLTLVGDIEVITDPDIKEEMWYDGLKFIFTGGPSDPAYCVLKFTTRRYNLMIDYKEAIGRLD